MFRLISVLIFVSLHSQLLAQNHTHFSASAARNVKLYRVAVKRIDGLRTTGILYAVTDSSLICFASNQLAINQFKSGQQPAFDTIRSADIKRITFRRRGQFLRTTGIGLGASAGLIALAAPMRTPTYGDLVVKVLLVVVLAPTVLLASVAAGLFPQAILYIGGHPAYFRWAYKRLSRRSVVAQLSSQAP